MGDRTSLSITILEDHYERARALDPDNNWIDRKYAWGSIMDADEGFLTFDHDDVNYAEFPLDTAFATSGIPFQVSHGNGMEYEQGGFGAMYSPEGHLHQYLYSGPYPTARLESEMLLEILQKYNKDQIFHIVMQHHLGSVPYFSWNEQLQNSKKFRANLAVTQDHTVLIHKFKELLQ